MHPTIRTSALYKAKSITQQTWSKTCRLDRFRFWNRKAMGNPWKPNGFWGKPYGFLGPKGPMKQPNLGGLLSVVDLLGFISYISISLYVCCICCFSDSCSSWLYPANTCVFFPFTGYLSSFWTQSWLFKYVCYIYIYI